MVRYWAEEGVTWFKAYTQISRAELGAAIDEAHKHGVKVTAHLCSVGFREAVALGIDALEHGMLTNTEWYPGKKPDPCPQASDRRHVRHARHEQPGRAANHSGDGQEEGRDDVDARRVRALQPRAACRSTSACWTRCIRTWRSRSPRTTSAARRRTTRVERAAFKKSMEFERAFVKAGGLLGAGSDPCCVSSIAGYGDQRNYELLVEAGFTPEQAVQIMTSNGAKILGFDKVVGTIAPGMQADIVIIAGDPVRTPGDIRNVETVFRRGLGYDSAKLRESIKGLVGLR